MFARNAVAAQPLPRRRVLAAVARRVRGVIIAFPAACCEGGIRYRRTACSCTTGCPDCHAWEEYCPCAAGRAREAADDDAAIAAALGDRPAQLTFPGATEDDAWGVF